MAIKAKVVNRRQLVGVEFDVASFQRATTPEVTLPTEYDSLKITNAEIENISGSLNGLPAGQGGTVALDDVTDVNATSPQDLSTLQYQSNIAKWVAVASTDFIDAIIDGGFPTTTYVAGFDIDGGVA